MNIKSFMVGLHTRSYTLIKSSLLKFDSYSRGDFGLEFGGEVEVFAGAEFDGSPSVIQHKGT